MFNILVFIYTVGEVYYYAFQTYFMYVFSSWQSPVILVIDYNLKTCKCAVLLDSASRHNLSYNISVSIRLLSEVSKKSDLLKVSTQTRI